MNTKTKKPKAPVIDGDYCIQLRYELGKNQTDFWRYLGLTQSAGSRYESESRPIPAPVRKLIFLLHVVGVSLTPAQQAAFDAIK